LDSTIWPLKFGALGRDPPHTTLGRIAPACQMPLN